MKKLKIVGLLKDFCAVKTLPNIEDAVDELDHSAVQQILFSDDELEFSQTPWTDRHQFLNFSITPFGCSLLAPTHLINQYMRRPVDQFNAILGLSKVKTPVVEISNDEYVAIQVDGQGFDAAQRVLELTAPLAMANISIFFITTYFSDYILVPVQARHTVLKTLQQRGFIFSQEAEAFVSQLSPSFTSNHDPITNRPRTSSSGSDHFRTRIPSTPSTPPAKDVPELQTRTFTKLAKHGIEPMTDSSLRLVHCAGGRESDSEFCRALKDGLTKVLLAGPGKLSHSGMNGNGRVKMPHCSSNQASFLSVTLSEEPISIMMEERLLPVLGSTLLGSRDEEDILIPIIFDLRDLGWNATGIVGGVAGKVSHGSQTYELAHGAVCDDEPVEISFLSSAKAGTLIVQAGHLETALQALVMGKQELRKSIKA